MVRAALTRPGITLNHMVSGIIYTESSTAHVRLSVAVPPSPRLGPQLLWLTYGYVGGHGATVSII